MDSGDILRQSKHAVGADTTYLDLYHSLGQVGADHVLQCLQDWPNSLAHAVAQPAACNTPRAPKIAPSLLQVSFFRNDK